MKARPELFASEKQGVRIDKLLFGIVLLILQLLQQSLNEDIAEYQKQVCVNCVEFINNIINDTFIQLLQPDQLQNFVISLIGALGSFFSHTQLIV